MNFCVHLESKSLNIHRSETRFQFTLIYFRLWCCCIANFWNGLPTFPKDVNGKSFRTVSCHEVTRCPRTLQFNFTVMKLRNPSGCLFPNWKHVNWSRQIWTMNKLSHILLLGKIYKNELDQERRAPYVSSGLINVCKVFNIAFCSLVNVWNTSFSSQKRNTGFNRDRSLFISNLWRPISDLSRR
jgi:hypothetical protein